MKDINNQRNTLEGVELLEKIRGYERYRLSSDAYQFDFGFRNFGEHESDWLSRASDRESDWQTPFKFDYDHPKVKQFELLLFEKKRDFNNPKEVSELIGRFSKLIKSMKIDEPEYNNSLSDIVVSGKGMCDAKSVLFGSMLTKNTNLEAQTIIGQCGRVQDRVSYPFHHQWMRITDGKYVYLFDPMYEKLAVFEQDGDLFYPMDEEDSHFSNLTPACYPAAKLMVRMNIQRYGGIRMVKSFNNDGAEMYVDNQESLSAQLSNQMTFVFEINQAEELEIHDGAIKTGIGDTSLYFPVKDFKKIE